MKTDESAGGESPAAQINRHNRLLASGSREEVSPLRVSAAPILPAFSTLAAKSVENLR